MGTKFIISSFLLANNSMVQDRDFIEEIKRSTESN